MGAYGVLSAAASAAALADKQEQSFYLQLWQDPPGWLTWLTFVVAFATLLREVHEYRVGRKDRIADREVATKEFWYTSVVVPRCVESIVSFLSDPARELRQLRSKAGALKPAESQELYRAFLANYKVGINELVYRIMLVAVLDDETYQKVRGSLEEVEDIVALHCVNETALGEEDRRKRHDNPDEAIGIKINDIVRHFMQLHHKLASTKSR